MREYRKLHPRIAVTQLLPTIDLLERLKTSPRAMVLYLPDIQDEINRLKAMFPSPP